jgi:hypothetical protein
VYERRPPLHRDTRVTQITRSKVEGVRDRVAVHYLLCEQFLVEPLCDFRPIDVTYGPIHDQQAVSCPEIPLDIPHRCDHALEPAEEHGRCKMHRLIRLGLVAFGRFTCAEKGQECIVELQLHQLCDRESTVTKAKPALTRIAHVLNTVTRKMDDVCRLHDVRRVLHSRRAHTLMQDFDATRVYNSSDMLDLRIHVVDNRKIGILSSLLRYECDAKIAMA